ncbi:MAG: hypothetical protein WB987_06105 [Candidatus Acidiferrales bacterium]
MTGRRYYITSLADWQRHAPRFANSHWLSLNEANGSAESDGTCIVVLIEADEGVHLDLDDDSAFEALPHPLAPIGISETAQAALAMHGVAPGATTFDAMEIISRAHPLLRHRVF